jgi:hypothetical protein
MELKLIKLDTINRNASLGNDYYVLNRDYPNWSKDLHENGNILNNNILENIAVNGIIHWYHTYHTMIDIDYNYYEKLLIFTYSPYSITFNDNIILNQLAIFANIEPIISIKQKTKHYELLTLYNNKIFDKYAILSWSHYLIDMVGKEKLIIFLQKLLSYVKKNYIWFEESWLTSFIKKYPIVKKMGIIFQKFKIVLEKIKTISHPDIYKLDSFVDMIQTLIYSLSMNYIDNFKNMNTDIIHISNKFNWINNEYFYQSIIPTNFNYDDMGTVKCLI